MNAVELAMTGATGVADVASNIWSAENAREQMRFQERMYKNAYRYKFNDIKKAGYNPILALDTTPGQTPAGASYRSTDIGRGVPGMVASAINLQKQGAEIKLLESQANVNNSEAAKNASKEQLNYQEIQNRVDDLLTNRTGRRLTRFKALTEEQKRQTEIEKQRLMRQQQLSEEDARLTGVMSRYVAAENIKLLGPKIAKLVTEIQLMKKQKVSEDELANLRSAETILRDMDIRLKNPELEYTEALGIAKPAVEQIMGLIGHILPVAAIIYGTSKFGATKNYSPKTTGKKLKMGFQPNK